MPCRFRTKPFCQFLLQLLLSKAFQHLSSFAGANMIDARELAAQVSRPDRLQNASPSHQ
jgi:hypothetical protein